MAFDGSDAVEGDSVLDDLTDEKQLLLDASTRARHWDGRVS